MNVHNHSLAKWLPNRGTAKTTGKKYAASWSLVSGVSLDLTRIVTNRHHTGGSKAPYQSTPRFLLFHTDIFRIFDQRLFLCRHTRCVGILCNLCFLRIKFAIPMTPPRACDRCSVWWGNRMKNRYKLGRCCPRGKRKLFFNDLGNDV